MIQPNHETTHLLIVGTISQWHEISLRLTRSNVTREENQMEDNRRCQLALSARVLFHSEKWSWRIWYIIYGIYNIWTEYGDSVFVAFLCLPSFSYRRTQHPVSDACLLSLAIAGITSEAARSRVINILRCLIFMKQLNNRNDTTQWSIFWDKKYNLRQAPKSGQTSWLFKGANRP